ncbi:MAG: DNA internalization-related competence protein ComEC/Rec2 [Deltaproteobacteria bacterium]|nr:DNA internalization-related competence protein ComEC/Rec2 [Deltaproteobacteria bacterium]
MRPLVPALIGFAAGIFIGDLAGLSYTAALVLFAASLLPLILLRYKGTRIDLLASIPPFFFLGIFFIHPYSAPVLPSNHIKNLMEPSGYRAGTPGQDVVGTVAGGAPRGLDTVRLAVDAERVMKDGTWVETTGRILLTVPPGAPALRPGDGIRFMARLREPANFGNPGEYDYAGRLRMEGISVTGTVRDAKLVVKTRDGEEGARRGLDSIRRRIREFIDGNAVNGAGLKALIIAETGGMDTETREAFAKTSTSHILAISGLHVGIVAMASVWLCLLILKRSEFLMLALNVKKAAMLASLAPVFAYGLISGPPVPAARAVIMVAVFTVSFVLDRGKDLWNTLCLAALVILALNPPSLWDISFQLSFAAVASLIAIVPALEGLLGERDKDNDEGWLRRVLRRRVLPPLMVTVAASAGTAPLIALYFHRVSLAGGAANLIAVPLASLIVPLLFAASGVAFLWEPLARLLLSGADALFGALVRVVDAFAAIPYSSSWVTTPTVLEIILFYGLVLCVVNVKRMRLCAYAAPLIIIALMADWGYWNYYARRTGELKVTFISIGQGDCALVEFPEGSTMLIDGGGFYNTEFDTGERIAAPVLWWRKIGRLDYAALSHPQRDHIAGLRFITEAFRPKEFWWSGRGGLGRLGAALMDAGTLIKTPKDLGGALRIGGATVEALHPFKDGFDVNNSSLVLRLTYGSRGVLFTGDIGKEAEEELMKRDVHADALKVAHHGSRWSSGAGFLSAVNPSVAVISAGRGNTFGFPHEETLARLRDAGASVYRTDRDGAVTVTTDGTILKVETYLTR